MSTSPKAQLFFTDPISHFGVQQGNNSSVLVIRASPGFHSLPLCEPLAIGENRLKVPGKTDRPIWAPSEIPLDLLLTPNAP